MVQPCRRAQIGTVLCTPAFRSVRGEKMFRELPRTQAAFPQAKAHGRAPRILSPLTDTLKKRAKNRANLRAAEGAVAP